LSQLLRVLLASRALRRFEHLPGLLHSLKRAKLVGGALLAARLRLRRRLRLRSLSAFEFIGSLLHLLRGLGEFRIAAIARELFKLASHFLRFVDHLLLLSLRTSATAALLLHLRAHLLL
jgi:hypothetical protein